MKLILAIGTGSFIGGICRYLLSKFITINTNSAFPYGTLVVNIVGCVLIGLLFGLVQKGQVSEEWKLILSIGVLGGFTTYSAFSYETISLIRNGQTAYAISYIILSLIIGLAGTFASYSLITSR